MVQVRSVQKLTEELKAARDKLERWLEDKEEQLDNENSKDYPSYDRIDVLEEQISTLQDALEHLESAIDVLESYE